MPLHRIETHAHTSLISPCGHLSPREILREYSRADYSGIVITDHLSPSLPIFHGVNSWRKMVRRFFAGYRAVRDMSYDFDLTVFPGFELSLPEMPGRDFLVYGIDESLLSELPNVFTMDLPTFKRFAEQAGALIFQAHPFRNNRPVDPALIDGLEICNCNPRHESKNDLATAFASRHGLLGLSGSDTHQLEDVARGGIALTGMPLSIAELVGWLRDRSDEIELLVPSGLTTR